MHSLHGCLGLGAEATKLAPRVVHTHPFRTGRAAPSTEVQKRRCPLCPTLIPCCHPSPPPACTRSGPEDERSLLHVDFFVERCRSAEHSPLLSCRRRKASVPSPDQQGLPCRELYLSPHVRDIRTGTRFSPGKYLKDKS